LVGPKQAPAHPVVAHVALTLPEGCVEAALAAPIAADSPLLGTPA
jgi:hypothetical protein